MPPPPPQRVLLFCLVAMAACGALALNSDDFTDVSNTVEPLAPAGEDEGFGRIVQDPAEVRHLRRLHRRVFALSASWKALSVAFVYAQPTALGGTPVYKDTGACNTVGQKVTFYDPPGSLSTCTLTAAQVIASQYTCTSSDIITSARFNTAQNALAAAATTLATYIQVQTDARTITFPGTGCAMLNISDIFTANLVVVVTFRATGNTEEYTSYGSNPCAFDSDSGRPVLVHINLDPKLLDDSRTAQISAQRMLLHSMAFSVALLPLWRHPADPSKTYWEFDNTTYPTGPASGTAVSGTKGAVKFLCRAVATSTVNLVTPNVVDAAQNFFNCSNMTAMPLEDLGYSAGLIYWEKSLLKGELMTKVVLPDQQQRYVTPLTVAALRDTGWYQVLDSYVSSTTSSWGYLRGCTYVSTSCKTGWPTNPLYNCGSDISKAPACGFDRSFTGTCNAAMLTQTLPAPYQYFNSALLGGTDLYANACPYIQAALDTNFGGYCSDAASSATTALTVGSIRGSNSLCYLSTTKAVTLGYNATQFSTCYVTVCTADGTLKVRVGNHFADCPAGSILRFLQPRTGVYVALNGTSKDVNLYVPDYIGRVTCPTGADRDTMCNGAIVPSYWPNATSISPNVGAANGGMTFTITGTNLVSCTSALIGGKSVAVLFHFPTGTLRGRTPYIGAGYGSGASDGLGLADVEIFCSIQGVCTGDGCGMTRLSAAFNVTQQLPCNFTDDITVCEAQPSCIWIGAVCIDAPVTAAPTPVPTPAPPPSSVDAGCFNDAPRYCQGTGKCAVESTLCLPCPSEGNWFQCWNSLCVTDQAHCPCRPDYPFRCSDQSCAALLSDCTKTCTSGLLCWTKDCVSTLSKCACPPSEPLVCAASGNRCGSDTSDDWCTSQAVCTLGGRCWNGDCVADTSKDCPCNLDAPKKCWDGTCISESASCPCPKNYPLDCGPSVGCLPTTSKCPTNTSSQTTCNLAQYRCPDTTCVSDATLCPCSNYTYEAPLSQIVAQVYDDALVFTQSHTYSVDLEWAPCGVDLSSLVTVKWSLSLVTASGATSAVSTLNMYMTGIVMTVPSTLLADNSSYVLTAVATAPNSMTATTQVFLATKSRNPQLFLAGAYRDVASSNTLFMSLTITDDDNPLLNQVSWSCCQASSVDATRCLDVTSNPCPLLLSSVSSVNTPSVSVQAVDGLPVGAYLFTAMYRGVSLSNAPVTIKSAADSCFVYTQLPQYRTTDPVVVLLEIESLDITASGVFYSIKWTMNGSTVAGQTSTSMTISAGSMPYTGPTTVSAVLTTAVATGTTCSVVVQPRQAVTTGLCQVTNILWGDADYNTNIGTAMKSTIEIDAFSWVVPPLLTARGETRRQLYRFGYTDLAGRVVYLSPTFTATARMRTLPPVLVGNPSLVQIRFFVEVVDEDNLVQSFETSTSRLFKNATCTFNVKAVPNIIAPAIVATLTATLNKATAASAPLPTILRQAQQLALLLQDPDVSLALRASMISTILQAITTARSNLQALAPAAAVASLTEFPPAQKSIVIVILQCIADVAVPSSSLGTANTATRLTTSDQLTTLTDAQTKMFVDLALGCVPTMFANVGTTTQAKSTSASTAQTSVVDSSKALRTTATARQRFDVVTHGPVLLRFLNWMGRPAVDANTTANLLDAIASVALLSPATVVISTGVTSTSGVGPIAAYQRTLLLAKKVFSVTVPTAPLSQFLVDLGDMLTTPSGSTVVCRIVSRLYPTAYLPFSATSGLTLAAPVAINTTGITVSYLPYQILSPVIAVHVVVEQDNNPVVLSPDVTLWVNMTYLTTSVPPYFSTQNVSCMELGVFFNGTESQAPSPHANSSELWVDNGPALFSGASLEVVTCPAYSPRAGMMSYVMLVARAPRFIISTPAPTKRDVLQSLSAIASTVSPVVWAAVALGSLIFLLCIVYLVVWLRSRSRQVEQREEVKEQSQLVTLGQLIHDDPELRTALELARARKIYLADL